MMIITIIIINKHKRLTAITTNKTSCSELHIHGIRSHVPSKYLELTAQGRSVVNKKDRIISYTAVKANLSLPTPRWYIGGAEVQLHAFLTSTLNGGGWLTSRPCHFNAGTRCTVQKGGWAPQPVCLTHCCQNLKTQYSGICSRLYFVHRTGAFMFGRCVDLKLFTELAATTHFSCNEHNSHKPLHTVSRHYLNLRDVKLTCVST